MRRRTAVTPAARPRPDASYTAAPAVPTRGFVLLCCAAVLVCAVLKLPGLLYPPTEADEQIYWQLAENLANRGTYTLRGSDLLGSLSAYIYDRPLFHHPPLFAALLVPFVLTGTQGAAVLVSWLGHCLSVIAVAVIGRHALRRTPAGATVTSPRFWLPVLGAAADPLMMFVSKRLWIDSLLAGLVAVAVAMLIVAEGRRRRMTLAFAGLLLGLAALAKLTALILVPVFLFAVLRTDSTWRERGASMLSIFLPVGLLVVPWMVVFYAQSGVFIPSWVKPDEKLMEIFPFLRVAVARPWYYYLGTLPLIMPLALVPVWVLARERALWGNRPIQIAVAWFSIILLAQTLLGAEGYGFQMRHIAPAVSAVYVLVLLALLERERPALLMVCGFAILVGAVTGAMHLLVPEFDEMLSLAKIGGLVLF